jgi:phosphoketolase
MDTAIKHCAEGIGIWQWAGQDLPEIRNWKWGSSK